MLPSLEKMGLGWHTMAVQYNLEHIKSLKANNKDDNNSRRLTSMEEKMK